MTMYNKLRRELKSVCSKLSLARATGADQATIEALMSARDELSYRVCAAEFDCSTEKRVFEEYVQHELSKMSPRYDTYERTLDRCFGAFEYMRMAWLQRHHDHPRLNDIDNMLCDWWSTGWRAEIATRFDSML